MLTDPGRASLPDLEIPASDGARSLARIGQVLGDAGVGLEGGGMWSGVARKVLVVDDVTAARAALDSGSAR